ncbi:MAG: ABC transporter substrate-binding protein, partial [Nitrososphaerales archaeon]
IPYNFNSTGDDGDAGKIFHQLYFRQAMQLLVNEKSSIGTVYRGYGYPTYGPVPVGPKNRFGTVERKHYPYQPDTKKAVSLLKRHGWRVVANAVDTCVHPGSGLRECGRGIPAAAQLDFDLQYSAGSSALVKLLSIEKSQWAKAGIKVNLIQAPAATVATDAIACTGGTGCSWELEDSGAGSNFVADYYPNGRTLFFTGSREDLGSYSSPITDNLIQQTEHTAVSLKYFVHYLAEQVPVVFQPDPPSVFYEVDRQLRGVVPLNPLGNDTPENYYFVAKRSH